MPYGIGNFLPAKAQKRWARRKTYNKKIARKNKKKKTVKKNARAIKKILNATERKMCDRVRGLNPPINGGTPWSGQFVYPGITVSPTGEDTATADLFAPSLLQLPCKSLNIGVPAQLYECPSASYARDGQWVQMTSLTIKYKIEATRQANERITLMLVHDSHPGQAPALTDVLALTVSDPVWAGLVNPVDIMRRSFINLEDANGTDARYKILWKKEHIVNPAEVNTANVPQMTQANVGLPMRAAYSSNQYVNPHRPEVYYGTVTLNTKYKLNYGTDDTNLTPINQTIRMFAFTTTTASLPQLSYFARFRFKDQ